MVSASHARQASDHFHLAELAFLSVNKYFAVALPVCSHSADRLGYIIAEPYGVDSDTPRLRSVFASMKSGRRDAARRVVFGGPRELARSIQRARILTRAYAADVQRLGSILRSTGWHSSLGDLSPTGGAEWGSLVVEIEFRMVDASRRHCQ